MSKKNDFQVLLDALGEPKSLLDDSTVDINDNDDDSEDYDGEMTIISALDRVVTGARKSGLRKKFWNKYSKEFNFLCQELEMTQKEVVIIGVMSEIEEEVSLGNLGAVLGLSRLKALSLMDEIKILKEKKWIRNHVTKGLGEERMEFCLAAGVVNALQNNHKFIPEKLEGLSERAFMDRLCLFFQKEGSNTHLPLKDKIQWLNEFCEVNQHLPLCKSYYSLKEEASKILLLLAVNDYLKYFGSRGIGLVTHEIENWFEQGFDLHIVETELKEGVQELFTLGFLEFGTNNGFADTCRWQLTPKACEDLLGGYKPMIRHKNTLRTRIDRDLRSHTEISEKELFYNSAEHRQIERIAEVISKDGFDKVKTRLSKSGFRGGICCLLYGMPGTGKTETVLQLARKTGRDIFQVNISELRDKYVGESEKNIKMVFQRYKSACNDCEHVPILLFNEADAIFGRRFENLCSSVEKMDNTIQNIILQEMETFDGILIATTNLTDNLDCAFDRRFLFKVEFTNPEVETRTKIWHSMLPEMNMEDCASFAKEFNLSGGQIENIARKCKIEYIINGVYADNTKIKLFCQEEYLNRKHVHKRIGF